MAGPNAQQNEERVVAWNWEEEGKSGEGPKEMKSM